MIKHEFDKGRLEGDGYGTSPIVSIKIGISDSESYDGYFSGEEYGFYRKELERGLREDLVDCSASDILEVIYRLVRKRAEKFYDYPPSLIDKAKETLNDSDNLEEVSRIQREISWIFNKINKI